MASLANTFETKSKHLVYTLAYFISRMALLTQVVFKGLHKLIIFKSLKSYCFHKLIIFKSLKSYCFHKANIFLCLTTIRITKKSKLNSFLTKPIGRSYMSWRRSSKELNRKKILKVESKDWKLKVTGSTKKLSWSVSDGVQNDA